MLLNILEIFILNFFSGRFLFPSRAIQLQVNHVNFPCECPLLSDIYLAKIYCVTQESLKVYITEYIIEKVMCTITFVDCCSPLYSCSLGRGWHMMRKITVAHTKLCIYQV